MSRLLAALFLFAGGAMPSPLILAGPLSMREMAGRVPHMGDGAEFSFGDYWAGVIFFRELPTPAGRTEVWSMVLLGWGRISPLSHSSVPQPIF